MSMPNILKKINAVDVTNSSDYIQKAEDDEIS